MNHIKGIIRNHRGLVDDDDIIFANGVINHVLLVRRNRDVKERVDRISIEVGIEFLSIVGV